MRTRFVVRHHPTTEIALQLVDGAVEFLAERHAIKLIEHGAMVSAKLRPFSVDNSTA